MLPGPTISCGGFIGEGKSTYVREMERAMGQAAQRDQPEQEGDAARKVMVFRDEGVGDFADLLEDFNRAMEGWTPGAPALNQAFYLQTFMCHKRVNAVTEVHEESAAHGGIPSLMERSLLDDRLLFAEPQHRSGVLSDAMWKAYKEEWRASVQHLCCCSGIVTLDTSEDQAVEYVRKRARSAEEAMSPEYVRGVCRTWREWEDAFFFPASQHPLWEGVLQDLVPQEWVDSGRLSFMRASDFFADPKDLAAWRRRNPEVVWKLREDNQEDWPQNPAAVKEKKRRLLRFATFLGSPYAAAA